MHYIFPLFSFLFLELFLVFLSICDVIFLSPVRQLLNVNFQEAESQAHLPRAVQFLMANAQRLASTLWLLRQFALAGAAVSLGYCWVMLTAKSQMISTGDAVISVIVIVMVTVIGTDVVPKIVAAKSPQRFLNWISVPMYWIVILMTPIEALVRRVTARVCRIAGISYRDATKAMTQDDFKQLVENARQDGILEKAEQEMIRSIFDFSETIVREIMTPRRDAICIGSTGTVRDVIQLIVENGHSRVPVFEGTTDSIVGFVYAKDLLAVSEAKRDLPLTRFLRPVVTIPETQSIEALLHQLKKSKTHLAIVVDEFGGMSGLVTLEDVIEEIVGDIQDEYDVDLVPELFEIVPGRYSVDAAMNITDFSNKTGAQIPESEDYDTVGGFLLQFLGKLPVSGDRISVRNAEFIVTEMGDKRILRVEYNAVSKRDSE